MRKQRQQYSAEVKAKVALETIKGARTVNEIGAHYEVHPTQVVQWKKQALGPLADGFRQWPESHGARG